MTPSVKIAIAIREDLEVWQKLNVAAFLPSGFGTAVPSLIGETYSDSDDQRYPPDDQQGWGWRFSLPRRHCRVLQE